VTYVLDTNVVSALMAGRGRILMARVPDLIVEDWSEES
jgi:predicted nucleic acid-binding protein